MTIAAAEGQTADPGALLETITRRIVREAANWEDRWDAFSGCVQAFAEFSNTSPEKSGDLPSIAALAEAIVLTFGVAPVVDKWQALIYFVSADARHKAMSVAWQVDHQDEVAEIIAQMPTIQ